MGKRVCLVDYENTAFAGLDGMELMQSGDRVRIICSNENIGSALVHVLSVYQDRNIKVDVEYMSERGSNALDFRLSCDIGYFMAQGETEQIFVVSKDKGYRHAVSEALRLNADIKIVCGVTVGDCINRSLAGMFETVESTNQAAASEETLEQEPKQTKKQAKKKAAPKKETGKTEAPKKTAVKKETQKKTAPKKEAVKKEAQKKDTKRKTTGQIAKLTKKERKVLAGEIQAYMETHATIDSKYFPHLAALASNADSVLDYRRAIKENLGKKLDAYEREAVEIYLHFRQ